MKKLLIYILKFYKKHISIFFYGSCKYYPSCCDYFLQSLEIFGIFKGSLIGIKRLFRCSLFSKKGGYDPVEKYNIK